MKNFTLGAYEDWERVTWEAEGQFSLLYHPIWIEAPAANVMAIIEESKTSMNPEVTHPAVFMEIIEEDMISRLTGRAEASGDGNLRWVMYISANDIQLRSKVGDEIGPKTGVAKHFLTTIVSLGGRVVHVGAGVPIAEASELLLDIHSLTKNRNPIGAIIDDDIAYLNTRFCRKPIPPSTAPSTRILALWQQSSLHSDSTSSIENGKILDSRDINSKLAAVKTYGEQACYADSDSAIVKPNRSHGTHIADRCFGASLESNNDLEAKMNQIDIIAVQLAPEHLQDTTGKHMITSVLQSTRWIVLKAIESAISGGHWRPLVINISLGTMAGLKDGQCLIQEEIDRLLNYYKRSSNTASDDIFAKAVFSFGNQSHDAMVALVDCRSTNAEDRSLGWRIQPMDYSSSYLELQCDQSNMPALTLTPPAGLAEDLEPISAIAPGEYAPVYYKGSEIGRVYCEIIDSIGANRKHHWIVALRPTASLKNTATAPAGLWKVQFSEMHSDCMVVAQVARDDNPMQKPAAGRPSYLQQTHQQSNNSPVSIDTLVAPLTRDGTHSAWIQNSPNVISVAAEYNNGKPWRFNGKGSKHASISTIANANEYEEGSRSPVQEGIRASGRYSGSSVYFAGTSVAAAEHTRKLLRELLENAEPSIPPTI